MGEITDWLAYVEKYKVNPRDTRALWQTHRIYIGAPDPNPFPRFRLWRA